MIEIESFKQPAHPVHHVAAELAPVVGGIAQDVELHIEEFLKLEPVLGLLHVAHVLGIMNLAQCLLAPDKVEGLNNEGRQRLGNTSCGNALYEGLGEFLHIVRHEARLLHALRRDVVRLHAHIGELDVSGPLNVGMGKLVAAAINAGPSEDDVFYANLIVVVDILAAIEPYEVYEPGAVGEVGHDALLACALVKLLEAHNLAFQLHERHVAGHLAYGIDAAAVDVFVRIILDKVTPRLDIKLFAQYLFSARTNARQIHDVLIEYIHCLLEFSDWSDFSD